MGINLLTAREASNLLRIHIRTIQRLSRQGKIKAIKIGNQWRFKKLDIEKYSSIGTDFSKEPVRKPNNFVERRAYPRINSNFKCQYSTNLPPFKEISSEGIIKNISAGGILLINSENEIDRIKINDPVELKFNLLSDNGQKINVDIKARVVRKVQNAVGIKFKNIYKGTQNRIIKYVG